MVEMDDVRVWLFYRMKMSEKGANNKKELNRRTRQYFKDVAEEEQILLNIIDNEIYGQNLVVLKKEYGDK